MQEEIILGVDIGATGIKGALVNVETGVLVSERHRILTPKPATASRVSKTVKELVDHFNWDDRIGCGFPAIIKNGTALSAANIDKSWIGTDTEKLLSKATGCTVATLNDADAAGLAEVQFGKGKNAKGVVIMITIGSGLGSALFVNGRLIPNTEFGHLYLPNDPKVAEYSCSNIARKRDELSWSEWAARFNVYLKHIERLFTPDLILLGGGGSKKFDKFADELTVKTPVVPASLLNNAGIIGAAVYARQFTSASF